MKGSIQVQSAEGKGANFQMQIPFEISENQHIHTSNNYHINDTTLSQFKIQNLQKNAPLSHQPQQNITENSLEILIVEDNLLAAETVKLQFKKLGCSTTVVHSGNEALQRVMQYHYDLILMDVGLPDMDGITITTKIRNFPDADRAQVPIIVLSGHVGPEHKQQCHKAGINAVLVKPLYQTQAKQIVDKLLLANDTTTITDLSAAITQSNKVIDLEEGARLIEADQKSALNLLTLFANKLPEEKKAIAATFHSQNFNECYTIIHRFYGGLCYCGAPLLRKSTKNLLVALRLEKSTDEITEHYENFQQQLESFSTVYEQSYAQDYPISNGS